LGTPQDGSCCRPFNRHKRSRLFRGLPLTVGPYMVRKETGPCRDLSTAASGNGS
jgi:hypothetical protein